MKKGEFGMARGPQGMLALGLGVAVCAVAYALWRRSKPHSRGTAASSLPQEAAALSEHSAEVDGLPMRWLEHGHGAPAVLVHGIPTSPMLWRRVMPRLRGVRAYAWEMVGYGGSIPAGEGRDISVARQADYLVAWMRHVGLERAVLVGHDLGGGVVQHVAVRYLERCAGLLLTNAIGYDSWPVPAVKAIRAAGPLVRRLPTPVIGLMQRALFSLGHDQPGMVKASTNFHWPHYRRHGAAEAFIRQINALDVRDTLAIQDALPRLGLPTRVVWGAADGFQKVRYGERFARDLGTALVRIEGGKHFTPEDHPDVIATALNDLVAETKAAATHSA